MKNQFLTGLMLMLISFSLFGQKEDPVYVISSSGSVTAKASGSKAEKLPSGSVMSPNSKISLKLGSKALVYQNAKFKNLTGKGSFLGNKLFESNMRSSTLNFDPFFGKFLEASFETAAYMTEGGAFSKSNVFRGDGWTVAGKGTTTGGWGVAGKGTTTGGWGVAGKGTTTGGWGVAGKGTTGGGWGVAGKGTTTGGWGVAGKGTTTGGWTPAQIVIGICTPGGFYRNATMRFKWLKFQGQKEYTFKISDDQNTVIHSVNTTDTSVTVDIPSLKLSNDKTYYWQIVAKSEAVQVSDEIPFQIMTEDQYSERKSTIKASEIYEAAEPFVKKLMEAVAMERGHMHYEASRLYEELTAENKDNNMVRIAYIGYSMRLGTYSRAEMLMK